MLPPPPLDIWDGERLSLNPVTWALKLLAFQPLPILEGEGWGEVHCYGP